MMSLIWGDYEEELRAQFHKGLLGGELPTNPGCRLYIAVFLKWDKGGTNPRIRG